MLQHNGGRRPIVCNVSWQRFVSNQDFSFLLALSFHFQNFVRLSYSNRASIFFNVYFVSNNDAVDFYFKTIRLKVKRSFAQIKLNEYCDMVESPHPSDKNEIRHQYFELFMSHVRTYFLAQNNYQHWSFY